MDWNMDDTLIGRREVNMSFWCDKSIKGALEIISGVNDTLEIHDDSNVYTITLTPNVYSTKYIQHTSNLIDEINNQLQINSAPIKAQLGATYGTTPYPEDYKPSSTDVLNSWDIFGGSDWNIVDNKLNLLVNESIDKIIYDPTKYTAKDYRVGGKFIPTTTVIDDNDVFGIIVRYKDKNNYYRIGYEGGGQDYGNSKIRIDKVIDGSLTVIGTSVSIDPWTNGNEYKLDVEVIDDTIKVYLNDNLVSTATDNTIKYGSYGFFGYSQTFSLYDINIVQIGGIDEYKDIRRNVLVLQHNDSSKEINDLTGNTSQFFRI